MIPRQSPSGPHIQLPSAPAEAINRSAGGTLSTANSARDLVRFFWNGTQYLASVVGLAFA